MKGNANLLYNLYVIDRWFQIIERMDMIINEAYRMRVGFKSLEHSFGLVTEYVKEFGKKFIEAIK